MAMNDDFYMGYLDETPSNLARWMRRLVWVLGVLVALLAALLAARQTPADQALFEFGIQRTFEGVLHENPLPRLRSVSSDGSTTDLPARWRREVWSAGVCPRSRRAARAL